jgi:glycerophosphoryl diester phosphodiesterase
MWVKKIAGAFVALMLAVTVVSVLTGPVEAAGTKMKCKNIAHRAMWKGTEEQVKGVKENARFGFTEIDARMTADNRIVAIHDFTLERATGGRSKKAVGDLTLRQIRNKRFVLGKRVETTRKLIVTAGRSKSAVMVTINSYARYKDQWDNGGLKALWKAANAHPKRSKVYFGGPGGEKAMRAAFPKASTFHRYSPKDDILQHAIDNGVDLAALPPKRFERKLVKDLQAAGVRVTTTQLERKRAVRSANKVGIKLVQTDNSRRTVRRWCR